MQAIDVVRTALQINDFDMRFIEDMRDAPLTQPTSRGGNHPLWVLGHLAWSEGAFRQVMCGDPNPLEHWTPRFGTGSEPRAEASRYPSFDEVLDAYREQRAATMALLEKVGDEGLEGPTISPPPGMEHLFDTLGKVFLIMASHHSRHCGQVMDARRVAGRKPLVF